MIKPGEMIRGRQASFAAHYKIPLYLLWGCWEKGVKYISILYLVLGEHRNWNPCPANWHYASHFGSCYFQLSLWNDFTWVEAKEECQKLDNESTLVYIDETDEDEFIFQLFWQFQSSWSWIGASFSSGII